MGRRTTDRGSIRKDDREKGKETLHERGRVEKGVIQKDGYRAGPHADYDRIQASTSRAEHIRSRPHRDRGRQGRDDHSRRRGLGWNPRGARERPPIGRYGACGYRGPHRCAKDENRRLKNNHQDPPGDSHREGPQRLPPQAPRGRLLGLRQDSEVDTLRGHTRRHYDSRRNGTGRPPPPPR